MAVQTAWSGVRRFLFWAIPAVLVAGLAWTFLPHGETPPSVSPQPSSTQAAALPENPGAPARKPLFRPYAQIHQGDLEGTDDSGGRRWRIVADDVVVLLVDPGFDAVGRYYDIFSQTTDEEVMGLLKAA